MAQTVGELQIKMAADIARLQQQMGEAQRTVERSMGRITSSVNSARNAFIAFASVSIGGGIRQQLGAITSAIDSYAKFETQLKLATKSQQEFAQAVSESKRIANVAQADLEGVGTLYARVSNSLMDYGVSAKQVSAITESFSLALKTSGATAQESRSAIIQFSQAMAAGALRSEEFNSVAEASPKFMRLLADSLNVPVGALKKLGSEGKLTTEVLANALIPNLERLRTEAAEIQTIGGAFTRLTNSLKETLGQLDKSFGITTTIANAFKLIAENGREIVIVLAGIVATGLVSFMAGLAVSAGKAVAALLAKAQAANVARAAMVAQAAATVDATRANLAMATLFAGSSATAIANQTRLQAELAKQMTAQAAAARNAGAGATVFRGIVTALGGPLNALITILGAAATAWFAFGKGVDDATQRADRAIAKYGQMNEAIKANNQQLIESEKKGSNKNEIKQCAIFGAFNKKQKMRRCRKSLALARSLRPEQTNLLRVTV